MERSRRLGSTYKAITMTAHYGMFRIGELTSGSHPILAINVFITRDRKKIQIILESSKTHSKANQPQMVAITSGMQASKGYYPTHYCPYKALVDFCSMRNRYH